MESKPKPLPNTPETNKPTYVPVPPHVLKVIIGDLPTPPSDTDAAARAALERFAAAAGVDDSYSSPQDNHIESISNFETRRAFQEGIDESTTTFKELLGLSAPDVEEILDSDINIQELARAYEQMVGEGKAPMVVLYPEDMTEPESRKLFSNLTAWQEGNDPDAATEKRKLKKYEKTKNANDGLYQSDKAQSLYGQPNATANSTATSISKNSHNWHLAVISTSEEKTSVNHHEVPYNQLSSEAKAALPSKNLYLAAQATRIRSKQSPLNPNTWTWLRGDDGSSALGGDFFVGGGRVVLGDFDVGNSYSFLVSLSSVWGKKT
jgi:hypothetical protein